MDYFQTWSKQNSDSKFEVLSTDSEGYNTPNGYIYDLSSCSYHLSFGLRNSFFEDAMIDQIRALPIAGPKTIYPLKDQTTRKLLDRINLDKTGKIFYTVSGAEAVENALKIARSFTGKKHILSRKISYHGATAGALSVTGDWRREDQVTLSEYTHFIPEPDSLNCIEDTERLIISLGENKIAALILETITGGNGVIIPSRSWWKEISKLCKKYQILLILDEVVCGFSRTGLDFGFQHFNVRPDIICMAKAISAGLFPFGAVYTNNEIAKYFDNNILCAGLTNYAHPIGIRLCNEVLDYTLKPDFKKNLDEIIKTLKTYKEKFEGIEDVVQVRQIGALMAVELSHTDFSFKTFLDKKIYLNVTAKNLIICPPLTTSPTNLKKSLDIVLTTIKDRK